MTITEFVVPGCPYCAQMGEILSELTDEHPELANVTLKIVDEYAEPAIADQYDYYYTPSFFVEKTKIYEAAPMRSYEDAKAMIEKALLEVLK